MGITHYIGTSTELEVAKGFIEHGFNVSKPMVPDSKYDLIVDAYGHLFKIQVKTPKLSSDGNSLNINLYSMALTNSGYKRIRHTNSDVDLFATAYNNHIYVIQFSDVQGQAQCTLRLNDSKNNQMIGIRKASNYDLNNIINNQQLLCYNN